jgi:hypothetical protein
MDEKLNYAGQVVVERIILLNGDKFEDLKPFLIQFDYYEDMFSHSSSATLTLSDSENLIDTFPILGDEWLYISFRTPTIDNLIELTFKIYKVGDRAIANASKQVYNLYLTSPDTFSDLNNKISKSFTGTSDNIIQSIVTGKTMLNSQKLVVAEQSTKSFQFISNWWTPFQCISYATTKAAKKDMSQSSNFMFFETPKNYIFSAVDSLYSKTPTLTYNYKQTVPRDSAGDIGTIRNIGEEMQTVLELSLDNNFDHLKQISNGAYAITSWAHDITFKRITKTKYDYKVDFDKTKHLAEFPCIGKLDVSKDGKILYVPEDSRNMTANSIDHAGKQTTSRQGLLGQMGMFRMQFNVNGRTDINVGDTINFNFYKSSKVDDAASDGMDKFYTGKYLVTSIHHKVTPAKHEMIIEVIRESLKSKIL